MTNEKFQAIKERAEELGIGTFDNPTEVVTKVDALEFAINAYDMAVETIQAELNHIYSLIPNKKTKDEKPVDPVTIIPKTEKESGVSDKNGETKK